MEVHQLKGFFARWYREHGRSFPWRDTGTSAYGVLIAEMLLRQTRASMVVPVWQAFLSRYPTPISCAEASQDALFKLVAPLGLGRQRVSALQSVSVALVSRHQGRVPRSLDALLALPHVGIYSAHAVLCFAYGRKTPVVDINVIRLFSRLTGRTFSPDNRRSQEVWDLATQILPAKKTREHNYGLLDFAAQVCKPRNPLCIVCPLAAHCVYNLKHIIKGGPISESRIDHT